LKLIAITESITELSSGTILCSDFFPHYPIDSHHVITRS